jgi:hypothetical protein
MKQRETVSFGNRSHLKSKGRLQAGVEIIGAHLGRNLKHERAIQLR